MLKEGSAPVTAYETCAETVTLGREVGRDDGKDIQWDAIYANEGIPPLTNIRQHGRDFMVELGNAVKGGAVEEVSVSFLRTSRGSRGDLWQRTVENALRASVPRSERR